MKPIISRDLEFLEVKDSSVGISRLKKAHEEKADFAQ